jgi:hypothetical protein
VDSQLLRYSQECAFSMLGSDVPGAWDRSQRAAHQASLAVDALGRPRGEMIIAAAWLHAVGEAPTARSTGFVPVDGAVNLLAQGWPSPIVSLVAHQGQARLIAPAFDAIEELALFERIQGWPSDILDYSIVMGMPEDSPSDAEACLRLASRGLPTSLRISARDRAERERRLRRAVDRVDAALIAARSPVPQGV